MNSLVEEKNITAAQWGGLISLSSILNEHTLIRYISKKGTLSNRNMSTYSGDMHVSDTFSVR